MGTYSTACPPCADSSGKRQRSLANGCIRDKDEACCTGQLSHAEVISALRHLSPFGSTAMCEPLPTPYQAVSDVLYSGQEQLSLTFGASVAEARAQLLTLQTAIRGQLYATYLEQCLQVSPEFRDRGRRVGSRILTQLLNTPASSRISSVHYADEAGLPVKIRPPVGWLSGGVDGGVAGSYDSALVMLDGLAQPFLDPFVEGLKEPFMRAVAEYQAKVQSTVATAAIGGLLGGIAAGLVTGFIIGRFAGRGGSGEGRK